MESEGVIVVSGIMAAGKSTVSQLLAERFQYGVHLRGDVFRRMIVSGQASMRDDSAAAQKQLQLRYRLACQVADGYADAGFTVVLEDVVIGELLREFLDGIRTRPRYLVVLTPRIAALIQELQRTPDRSSHPAIYRAHDSQLLE